MGYPILIIKKIKTTELSKTEEHEKNTYTKKINDIILGLNVKKKIRKDAIVLCQCYITCNKEFFIDKTEVEIKDFFASSATFLSKKFGEENIISQVIHFHDSPHMHFNFVPIVNGRLCAKDLFKKKDLYKLHDDFWRHNQLNNYRLSRDKNSYEKNDIKKTINKLDFNFSDIRVSEKTDKTSGQKFIVMTPDDFNKIKEKFKEYEAIIKKIKV